MFKKKLAPGDGEGMGNFDADKQSTESRSTKSASTKSERTKSSSTKLAGDRAEDQALALLLSEGLRLVQRNYRVARGPARRGAEIDLIMEDSEGTLVFVEVRSRSSRKQGGAAASVGHHKRQSLLFGAQHYLLRQGVLPPCRFDVVEVENGHCQWLPAAFDASG